MKAYSNIILLFIDACFSGGARARPLIEGRTVVIKPNENFLSGKLVVFAAASGDQTAHQYDAKQHGIFTYFLLKKLQETSGRVTYGELADYIGNEVTHNAIRIKDVTQTPEVRSSNDVGNSWRTWSFR